MPQGKPAKITLIRKGINPYARKKNKHKKPKVPGHKSTKRGPLQRITEEERENISKDFFELNKKYSDKRIIQDLREKHHRDARTIITIVSDTLEGQNKQLLQEQLERFGSGVGIDWAAYLPRALELFHAGLYDSINLTTTEKEFVKLVFSANSIKKQPEEQKPEGDKTSDIFGTEE